MLCIKQLLQEGKSIQGEITPRGQVRTFRSNRFIALNDGSTIENVQVVVDFENTDPELLKRITIGAAIEVRGQVVESQGKGQAVEVQVTTISILGDSNPEEYPIQPKKHSLEFSHEDVHLRVRSSTFSTVMRVRSTLAYAIHKYLQDSGFFYVNTPIITGSNAEGAGEMFRVTTLDAKSPPLTEDGRVDYKKDFFGREADLTVSGQLEGETFAMALGKIYTSGSTFRTEDSNTSRHLAKFWTIKPEMAFFGLIDNMNLAENFIKYVLKCALEVRHDDLGLLNKRFLEEERGKPQQERSSMSPVEKLEFVMNNDFKRINYTETIDILKSCNRNEKKKSQYLVDEWGVGLQGEHERYLVEKRFECPVILYDCLVSVKAFYMRLNDDDETVRAMDILFPDIGEIVGSSQHEGRYEVLKKKIVNLNMDEVTLWWYLGLREFGIAIHSGFGLDFERLVLFATDMTNIRDIVPYPCTPQSVEL